MELHIIFFIIGVILGLFGIVASIVDEDSAGIILLILGSICLFLATIIKDNTKKEKCFEYPASSYTLEYKVTEFHGKVDTIYVLTSKKQ